MSEQQLHPSLNHTLEALAQNPRTQTRVIARHLASIEAAIKNGVELACIHEALRANGVTLSFRGFTTALTRCRKAARKLNSQRPALPVANPSAPVVNAAPALPAMPAAPNPRPPVEAKTSFEDLLGPTDADVARGYFNRLRAEGRMPPASKVEDA